MAKFSLFQDDTILRKIDEVRLLESRKSARLVNSDTDFSKLADVNISDNKSGKKSKAIEVPTRSDYVQIAGWVNQWYASSPFKTIESLT